jgi:tRNA (guanosine-2'-O-)-methyltransferase
MPSPGPSAEPIEAGGLLFEPAGVVRILMPYLTAARAARIESVLAERTYDTAPVLEGLYDRGNVSAVIRTAEALGCQAVHIVELQEAFKEANRVTQGADKWLDIHRWDTTRACVACLRARGYRIVAMCMEDAEPIGSLAFDTPTALCFGSEKDGLSPELMELADARAVIPMGGFTRSFNISVAAALTLYHVREDRVRRLGRHGSLTPAQHEALLARYCMLSQANAEHILRRDAERNGARAARLDFPLRPGIE